MDIDEQTTASLGEKLAGLDLNDAEREALNAVFDAADTNEVSGFGLPDRQPLSSCYQKITWTVVTMPTPGQTG